MNKLAEEINQQRVDDSARCLTRLTPVARTLLCETEQEKNGFPLSMRVSRTHYPRLIQPRHFLEQGMHKFSSLLCINRFHFHEGSPVRVIDMQIGCLLTQYIEAGAALILPQGAA